MSKLDKLRQVKVKVPDVSKVIRVYAKPDRYAIWIAKAVAFIVTPPRQRKMMGSDVLNTQLAFLKGVIDSESWKEKCADLGFRSRTEKIEAKLLPGIMTHFVLRKRRIEESVRREIAKGCKQIVSFGPGLDTLLPRLAEEFPDITCIEADLQATQRAKMSVLRTRPRNLHFVDINLNEPYLEKVMMEATPFNKRERTYFIAEGLLMWLEDDDVERLMSFMQDHGALGSRFAFTFLERGVDHKAFFPEVNFFTDALLRLYKVQFGWGVRIEHISRYLNDRYFGLMEVETPEELRQRYASELLPPLKRKPVGDYLAFAELVFIDESPTGTGPNQRKFV
jgi:methyltransferase (TIGR00027 family)